MITLRITAALFLPLVLLGAAPNRLRTSTPPIYFEPNLGQAESAVEYLARTPQYQIRLRRQGAELLLRRRAFPSLCLNQSKQGRDPLPICRDSATAHAAVTLSFQNSRQDSPFSGVDRRQSYSNYFQGTDPARWKTGVPHFAKVRQTDLYPGIDIEYYPAGTSIEFDLIVQAQADPSRIAIAWDRPARLTKAGELIVSTEAGDLVQQPPVAYQKLANGKRVMVPVRYVRRDGGGGGSAVGLALGRYDRSKPLVIDPVLTYSTYLGGTLNDEVNGLAVDAAGNAYACGTTTSTNFPLRNAIDGTLAAEDAFVLKLNPGGTDLVYATFLGGSGNNDECHGVGVDPQNNAYLLGITNSADFPMVNALDNSLAGVDFFVTKVNAAGNALVYSTYLGGSGTETAGDGGSIAVDERGYVYVAGSTDSNNYPTTAGGFDTTYAGGRDAVVTKIEPDGQALTFSIYLGGTLEEVLGGLTIDGASNVYVTGYTFSPEFPVTAGAADTTLGAPDDTFITKINPTGSGLVYSTFLGGTPSDFGMAIAVDAFGRAHVAGHTFAANFPTTVGAFDRSFGGNTDVFVAKLNSDGSAFHFATLLGGTEFDFASSIAVDAGGNILVGGATFSAGFPITADAVDSTQSASEGFVSVLDPTGSALRYSTFFGGPTTDAVARVAYDSANNAYFAGSTAIGIPVVAGSFDTTSNNGLEGFAAKLSEFNFPICNAAADPSNAVVPAAGVQGAQYTATAPATPPNNCTWTAVSGHPGLVPLIAPVSGTLAGTVSYNVGANPNSGPRFFSIATTHHLHNIAQAGTSTAQVFTDVPNNHPFFQQILGLRDKGITLGCTASLYCPGDTVTRGQMAAFLMRALAGDTFAFPATQRFTDVPPTHPFFRFIQMMAVLGITSGCGNNQYCPDDPVTRGQMAVFVLRALSGNTFPFPAAQAFGDVAPTHPFYRYVQAMLQRGITAGVGGGLFGIDQPVTREQMAAFLMRAFAVK